MMKNRVCGVVLGGLGGTAIFSGPHLRASSIAGTLLERYIG
jgi:hypothetical protein